VRGWFLLTRGALFLALAGAAAGCGRLGFDPLSQGSGDGGGPDDGGIPSDSGSVTADAGLPATCDIGDLRYVVTTEVDESDAGESPEPPHLGAGLSLREAIGLSNGRAGRECIHFDRAMTIEIPVAELPAIDDPAGVEIDGAGAVQLVGIPILPQIPTGIDLIAGSSAVRGLDVANFEIGIQAKSTGNTVGPGNRTHGCSIGVRIDAAGNTVRGLRSHDNTEHGIQIPALIDDTEVTQVLLYRNANDGIQVSGTGLVVRHATIALNQVGIAASGDASGLVVENSIFYQQGGAGVSVAAPDDVDLLDFCDFFDDTCDNCDAGASSITDDPLFLDVVANDYRLGEGSPAINAGTDTGLDVNGDQPGSFNGAAPDMGALESD
jgi:hypothetical protein